MKRALTLTMLVLLLAAPAASQAAVPKTSLQQIENEVMCQVCGTPLALAQDAPEAQRERAYIVALIDQGQTKGQIEQALVSQYGPSVLAVPRDRGFGLAAYLVPAAAICAAASALAFAVVRWRRLRHNAAQAPAQPRTAREESAYRRLADDMSRHDL